MLVFATLLACRSSTLNLRRIDGPYLGVTIEQDVAVRTGKRQSLAQLLYDPVAGRILRDVEV
jgi:hypothetical protein